MSTDIETLYDVVERTWPPAKSWTSGPFTLRDGAGGGKRVSAATANGPVTAEDLPQAEDAMRDMGQTPLFMIRQGEDALDALLADHGYAVIDPVNVYVSPAAPLMAQDIPRVTTFVVWEPLEIMRDLWADGGIGPQRIAVMERVTGPKTGVLGRRTDQPAATAFVAIHNGIAMVHALEVAQRHRRGGMGRFVMNQAARWAAINGADRVAD